MIDIYQDDVDVQTMLKLSFDPRVLRELTRPERDMRSRPDASKQYIKMDGEFSAFLQKHVVSPNNRGALRVKTDVVVMGPGFGGL